VREDAEKVVAATLGTGTVVLALQPLAARRNGARGRAARDV
jgi:hypothetical protein